MKKIAGCILVFFIGLGAVRHSYGQCTTEIISGHVVITSNQGCAPFYMEIKNLYKNSTADAVFTVNWGDGTIETYNGSDDPVDGGALDPAYTPDFSHTYTTNNAQCGNTIIIEATNPCTDPEDARLELQVSVWDTDQLGLAINPGEFRVCQGAAASVQFTDESDWNCFPRTFRQNDPPRYIQWVYEGGSMTIPGVAAGSSGAVIPVNDTGAQSDVLNIPANDPANPGNPYDVGDEFFVRLNNWNQCNPLGEAPVTTTARIVIVAAPDPDFVTRKETSGNPIQTAFCVDDIVYFDNESSGPAGSNLAYTWQFYDGPDDSYPLIETKTSTNPVLAYSTGGAKLVRLSVTDRNAVGGCSSVVEKVINVYPTTIAQINASQTNFCKDESSASSFPVTFTDVSTGSTANTEWRWEFYDENNTLYKSFPASGFSSSKLGPFTETYSNPGRYKVVLITRDNITGCDTRDEKFINIYLNPIADFENSLSCEGTAIDFINKSTLTSINGNVISKLEWDFDYNGTTFTADETHTNTISDTSTQTFPAGVRQVALRISEDQFGCSAIVIKDIEVFQKPVANFSKDKLNGCSPLEVTVNNDSHALQPVTIDKYTWSVDYGSGFQDALTQEVSHPDFADTAALTFTNTASAPQQFAFKLKAWSAEGCYAESAPQTVEVFPSFKPGFNHLNYDPLADNCSPVSVLFQVDEDTRDLNPTQYEWKISLGGDVIYEETKPASDPQLDYEFDASGINVNNFKIHLNAPIPGVCMSDSVMMIKVNPIPISVFNIDTLDFNCDKILLNVDAEQKGLVEYNWTITEGASVYEIDTLGDNFNWEIPRPATGSVDTNISFKLKTSNFTFCESTEETNGLSVPPQDDIGTAFTATPRDLIYPNTLVFIENETHAGPWNYQWDFGDGQATTEANPGYHSYPGIGTYKMRLTVNTDFCTEEDSAEIKIVAPPLFVDFGYTPNEGCAPLTVQFINKSINAVDGSYLWDFGDGNTSVVKNPTYTYTEPGTYSVSLTASNAGGLTFTEIKQNIIVVAEPPVVDFTVGPKVQVFPNSMVTIENRSLTQTSAPSYLWDFGDGIYTIEESPDFHIYEFPGEYFVKLSVTEKACTSIDSVWITVEEPLPAIVDFDFKPGYGCAPVTVEFVNQTVGAEEDSYVWNFGDGSAESYEKNPKHTYHKPGVYSVSLRAKNITGEESFIVKESAITVHAYPNASFAVDPEKQVFPDATVNIVNPGVTHQRTYSWDFGDGTTSARANPEPHQYAEPGYYNIAYTVEENGCISTDTVEIFIEPTPPVVDFEYHPASGCVPLTVSFRNKSLYADPATYKWDFGDGFGASNLEHPEYTYYEPGIYTVSLEATNKSGVIVTETKEHIIEVYETPIASFFARPEEVKAPDEEMHITNRSHNAVKYTWNLGDGTISYEEEPRHKYLGVGEYDITLIAESEKGCTDTLTIEKAVAAVLESKVRVPNAFTPSLDGPSGGYIGSNGHNDVFYPISEGVTQYHMQIYNRWGELIFETNNKNYGWDGYHNGKICPQDVYIYKVNVKYLDGREGTLFGDVTLIR